MKDRKSEVVVTGINGFVGAHLARQLKSEGRQVVGVGREIEPNGDVSSYLDSYVKADLLSEQDTNSIPLKTASAIIHLAGLASVAESFDKPDLYKEGNAAMTQNLLQAAAQQGFKGRVIAVSTGALYSPSEQMPLNETSETAQNSPYAIGKIRAEEVVKRYRAEGMDAVIVRPFNHIGPGQGRGFLVGDLYDQLDTARAAGINEIQVGNLTTKRDYTDVRDIVKAYSLLAHAESLQFDTYNVATGVSHTGFDILNYLKAAMQLDNIEPVVDPSKVRPTDVMDITGDASRIKTELGWQPELAISDAINDFVTQKRNQA